MFLIGFGFFGFPCLVVSILFAYLERTEGRYERRYFWAGTIIWAGIVTGVVEVFIFNIMNLPLYRVVSAESFVAVGILTDTIFTIHRQAANGSSPLTSSDLHPVSGWRLVLHGLLAAIVVFDALALWPFFLWVYALPPALAIFIAVDQAIRFGARRMRLATLLNSAAMTLTLMAAWLLWYAFVMLAFAMHTRSRSILAMLMMAVYVAVVISILRLQTRRGATVQNDALD